MLEALIKDAVSFVPYTVIHPSDKHIHAYLTQWFSSNGYVEVPDRYTLLSRSPVAAYRHFDHPEELMCISAWRNPRNYVVQSFRKEKIHPADRLPRGVFLLTDHCVFYDRNNEHCKQCGTKYYYCEPCCNLRTDLRRRIIPVAILWILVVVNPCKVYQRVLEYLCELIIRVN